MAKRIIAAIVCFLALFAFLGFYVPYVSVSNEIVRIERDVYDAMNQISAKEAKNEEIRIQVLAEVGSIDESRLDEDLSIITDVLNVAFTWASYEEYNQMRATLVEDYGFDENGQFLTDVFGYLPTADDSGYNFIDSNGLAIEFASCTLYCIGVNMSDYQYFGELRYRAINPVAGSSIGVTYGFMLTTDAEGKIADLFVMDAG